MNIDYDSYNSRPELAWRPYWFYCPHYISEFPGMILPSRQIIFSEPWIILFEVIQPMIQLTGRGPTVGRDLHSGDPSQFHRNSPEPRWASCKLLSNRCVREDSTPIRREVRLDNFDVPERPDHFDNLVNHDQRSTEIYRTSSPSDEICNSTFTTLWPTSSVHATWAKRSPSVNETQGI